MADIFVTADLEDDAEKIILERIDGEALTDFYQDSVTTKIDITKQGLLQNLVI